MRNTTPGSSRPRLSPSLLLLEATLALAAAHPAAAYDRPWAIGHRGGNHLRPENTIPAYTFTVNGGATGAEIDIWLSSDGFPVLHHDATVDRTTDGTGIIHQKTLAEILTLDAGSWFGSGEWTGTPVPTMQEGLAVLNGSKLVLDIKAISYVPTIAQTLVDESFPLDDVWNWNRFGTGASFEALLPATHIVTEMTPAIDREWRIYERTLLGEDGIAVTYNKKDKDYVDLAHSYGLVVLTNTVVFPWFQRQIDEGVDIVVGSNATGFADSFFPAPAPECDDGLDNDGDGLFDYPADPSCWSAMDDHELAVCSDGIDNDGDGNTDHPNDPGCFAPFSNVEDPQCSDGIDNNGDGDVDYPADAGCFAVFDQGEQAACANGIDDDGDGLADYPLDPGCPDLWSTVENPECNDGLDNDGDGLVDYPADGGCLAAGNISEVAGIYPSCNDAVDNDGDGLIDHPEDPECLGPNDDSEAAECGDGVDNDNDGLQDGNDPDCAISGGLTEQGACRDGLDGDGDGVIDLLDPGCVNGNDLTEGSDCSDGIDNDGDGQIDFPADADCDWPGDSREQPECSDAIDNDGDRETDHPADSDCDDPLDPSESDACQDGVDNDLDGEVDLADAGCWGPIDRSEEPDCSDTLDNDGDGLTDFPADPECLDAAGDFEWILLPTPALTPLGGALAALAMGLAAQRLRRRRDGAAGREARRSGPEDTRPLP